MTASELILHPSSSFHCELWLLKRGGNVCVCPSGLNSTLIMAIKKKHLDLNKKLEIISV
jgi:hypothetical protein